MGLSSQITILSAVISFLFFSFQVIASEAMLNALQNSDVNAVLALIQNDAQLLIQYRSPITTLAIQQNHAALRRKMLSYWNTVQNTSEDERELISRAIKTEIAYIRTLEHHNDADIETIRVCLSLILYLDLKQNFYDALIFIAYPLIDVRKDSYKILGQFKDDRMFPIIMKLAASENPLERTYALDAFYYIKDERTVPLLLNALKDKNKSVRYYAIRTLENMERADAIPYFIRLVQEDVDSEVRIKSIQVLAKVGSRAAYGVIAKSASDNDPDVRREAIQALLDYKDTSGAYYISEQLARESENPLKEQQIKALITLKNSGGMVGLNKIITREENRFLRLWAIYAAGYIADARGFDAVYSVLTDENQEIRAEAAAAIGFFRNKKAVPQLIELVHYDADYSVRSAALYSLRRINSEESYPDIFDISEDHPDYKIRLQGKEIMRELLRSRYKK